MMVPVTGGTDKHDLPFILLFVSVILVVRVGSLCLYKEFFLSNVNFSAVSN